MLVFKIVESLQCTLNINLIRSKFKSVVKGSSNVELLMLSETKIDESFPNGQFLIKVFGDPFRIDRNWGEEFCFMLEKIFWRSFYLLRFYQQKVFLLKLIYGKKIFNFLFLTHIEIM